MKVTEIAAAVLIQITQIKWILLGILVIFVIGLAGIIVTILLTRKTSNRERD